MKDRSESVRCFISLGSNLGNREEFLKKARNFIQNSTRCQIGKCSQVQETKALELTDQPDFLNQVIEIFTTYSPTELLDFLFDIEKKLDRVRTIKKGPRTIDLDIILYGDKIIREKRLIVPHPGIFKRPFLVQLIFQIDNNIIIPGTDTKIRNLIVKKNYKNSEKYNY
jgi:2-amino-4-hydroxy-6-hydroxymethyldihydropteridine diphosphokinase